MDRIQAPIYPRPMVPVKPRDASPSTPQKLKGTIVGVREGRSGEIGHTQILTIKLNVSAPEAKRLLHADIEIIIPRR